VAAILPRKTGVALRAVTDGCLEESTVLAFLGGTLKADARAAVETHVAACRACADLVTWAAADQASSTMRLPGHEGRPFVGQLQPGSRVGRYQILGAVGRGGMGEVYAAYHPDLDRRIALKVVQGLGGDTGERRARLLREARAIARLSHPNVVTVHDAGTFGDRVFIAMEFVDGMTVDNWLRAVPRTWQQIVDVFIAAGRGLAAAHAAGVIHRDFKPQNVMIGRDGAVRVMDFGLARLAQDDTADDRTLDESGSAPTVRIDTVTKTGAFIGTPAYMSPEQSRRETSDARSDQFSFCVALHEALYGTRPSATTRDAGSPTVEPSKSPSRGTTAPNWLRAILRRGTSQEKEKRYPSMNALLLALERDRTRVRRRVSMLAAAGAALLLSGGGWRLAHGNRFVCIVPKERVAAAWAPGDSGDARRQSIHRAFASTGRATAETSWERVSKVLDEYVTAWSAMYLQTCEATHVRGEQSAEVLDLRTSCLNDNLDQVQALTDALVIADSAIVSRAVAAAHDLTPISRCADVALLKSAVPLPKDERTLREVRRLRRFLMEIETLDDVGKPTVGLAKALALQPDVEATQYKPLRAELLELCGRLQSRLNMPAAEQTLEDALFAAVEGRDELTAARAAVSLVFEVGFSRGRPADGKRWARMAHAILDRSHEQYSRIRGWLLSNEATIVWTEGNFQAAVALTERSIALKERSAGRDHPDVALGFSNLAFCLMSLNRLPEALDAADRAVSTLATHGDPANPILAWALNNKGEVLRALGKPSEALPHFRQALAIYESSLSATDVAAADPLTGIGEAELAQGKPASAVQPLQRALSLREQAHYQELFVAQTKFALARAVWQSDGDRRRARTLASAARDVYERHSHVERQRAVEAWLSAHDPSSFHPRDGR
jgi:eukaryotic-like serine/threonine-protein kinase